MVPGPKLGFLQWLQARFVSDLHELDNVAEYLAKVGYSAPCKGVSSFENGENPVNGTEVCVDNQNSGDDDQRSVGRINSGDGDRVSVGGEDCGNRDDACQNRSSTEPCLNPDTLEKIL